MFKLWQYFAVVFLRLFPGVARITGARLQAAGMTRDDAENLGLLETSYFGVGFAYAPIFGNDSSESSGYGAQTTGTTVLMRVVPRDGWLWGLVLDADSPSDIMLAAISVNNKVVLDGGAGIPLAVFSEHVTPSRAGMFAVQAGDHVAVHVNNNDSGSAHAVSAGFRFDAVQSRYSGIPVTFDAAAMQKARGTYLLVREIRQREREAAREAARAEQVRAEQVRAEQVREQWFRTVATLVPRTVPDEITGP